MKRLNVTKWICGVLCLLGLFFPVFDASAGVTLNYFYDLNDGASSPPPGWTEGGGGSAQRVGMKLEVSGGTIIYTRDVPADVAVSIEGVVHADSVGGVGDRGTRLWLAIGDMLMFEHRLIEARLEEVAGGASKIVLRDGYDSGNFKGEIDLNWTVNDPAIRVRLKCQNINSTDYIVLQGEVSETGPGAAPVNWDDPTDRNPDPDTATSIKVPVSDFLTQFGLLNQAGFGNAVAGSYNSFWEYIHLTVADDTSTPLPYWPAMPPTPMLTLTTAEPPHEVTSQVDLPVGAYLANDAATLVLDTLSGNLSSAPIQDPSASPALHIETFTGLAGDQTVTGWVAIADVSGRTSIGPSTSVDLPPAQEDPIIEVTPSEFDFGNVTVGDSVTTIITIQNIGGQILTVPNVYLTTYSDPSFSITTTPPLPAQLDGNVNGTADVEITFQPTTAGYKTTSLVIESDDLVHPVVTVSLGGEGVADTPEPVTMDDIIAFFDESVEAGTIRGRGDKSWIVKKRLKAFRFMLLAAGTLIDEGYLGWGCFTLNRIKLRSDDYPRPPDFIVGDAREELVDMILQLRADLGC